MKAIARLGQIVLSGLDWLGGVTSLLFRLVRVGVRRPWGIDDIAAQMVHLGVKSLPITLFLSVFIGMVLAVQFGEALRDFGATMKLGDAASLALVRELVPTLLALTVGSKMAAGIAAELGSMKVTEQIDAVAALGADPIKKLVMPRLVATTIAMPILCIVSFTVGMIGAMAVCDFQFSLPAGFFLSTALDATFLADFWNGYLKTPIFGMIIALVGCHYGLNTRGGTQGVGRSTTQAVVVTSVSILLADFGLTNLYAFLIPK